MAEARKPKQQRSRQTFERILDAADLEFGERGMEAAQMTAIAARAGVAAGTMYQFFPDKEAVAQALAARYLADVESVLVPALEQIHDVESAMQLGRLLVQGAAALFHQHPGYYSFTGERKPGSKDSPAWPVRKLLLDGFEAALDRAGIQLAVPHRRHVIDNAVETVRHLLFVGPGQDLDWDDHVQEIETMVLAYFAAHMGIPAPTPGR